MKTILVSGASGIVGYGILKSLRASELSLCLIGTSIYEDSVAPKYCDTFVKAIPTNDPGYISWLVQVINELKVDLVIPGIDVDMYKWADNCDILESNNCKVVMNNPELITLCKDKWEFFNRMKEAKNPNLIPSSLSNDADVLEKEMGLPLILKPRHGFGSKGIVKVFDKTSLTEHLNRIGKELLVQPLVGDDENEYTVGAFCDGKGGFSARIAFRRKLSVNGFTEKADVVSSEEFEEIIKGLCQIFKPLGPTNFQFRNHNGFFLLLEINPRISSSTSIRTGFGYNEAEMAVKFYLNGEMPDQPQIREGRAVRYVEDYIELS